MNYFVISEVCIMESEGAWDKEHREAAVQAERIFFWEQIPGRAAGKKSTFRS